MKYFIFIFILICLSSCEVTENIANDTPNENTPNEIQQRQILFLSDKETSRLQIYLMNSDGTNQRRITSDSLHYGFAAFSPDGSKIVANSQTWNVSDDIFIMNLDGSEFIQLTNAPGDDNQPEFSRDGSKILFLSTRDGNREIYIMDRYGSNQTRLTFNSIIDYAPQFTPDGLSVLYISIDEETHRLDINLMSLSTGNVTCLTSDKNYQMPTIFTRDNSMAQFALKPSISPDRSKIAFVTYNQSVEDYEVRIMNFDGNNCLLISDELGYNIDPVFTPEGDKIIYMSHRSGKYDLYEATLDGRITNQVTYNLGHAYFSQFSPDGRNILLLGDPVAMCFHIYVINRDGTNVRQLTSGSYNNYCASYQPLSGDL